MSHHHDHAHEGHDCCGHDHKHEHAHAHAHDHDQEHDQEHEHEHVHSDDCCAHDHVSDAEWTRRFFAFLQAVVLIMIGGIMCYFVASGRIDGQNPQSPYVTGWFKVLVLCGGLAIMVMGVFNWLMRNRTVDCGHDHGGDADSENHALPGQPAAYPHTHEGSVLGRAVTLLLLSGSVAAATMLTPDQLSSRYVQFKAASYGNDRNSAARLAKESPGLAAAKAQGGFTLEKVEQYLKRTPEGNFPLSVMNLHYMSADPEYATVMEGQMVETTGQVVKDEINPGPGHLRVVTMQVTCCAADARPYSIPIVFEGKLPDYVEMGWYNITGKLEFTRERGMKMAMLKATNLTATVRPPEQRMPF